MFAFLFGKRERPNSISNSLYNMLNSTPGLTLPPDPTTLTLLKDPNLDAFLRIGNTHNQHYIPHARGRIIRLFEMTQFWCEYKTNNDLNDVRSCDPHPLSKLTWQRFEHNLSPSSKLFRDCKNTELLDRFVRLLVTARRNWLVANGYSMGEVPGSKMVARIHSCLLVLKKRRMMGYEMEAGDGDEWLRFEVSVEDVDDIVKNCERRYG